MSNRSNDVVESDLTDSKFDSSNDVENTTEIEIKLDNSLDTAKNDLTESKKNSLENAANENDSKHKSNSFNTVEPKHIELLTDDERATIIASVRNGFEQPYYDVKFYKNGNHRIIKRKLKQSSTAQQIINSQPLPPATETKKYYTDNQLLFEHIIELNAKIDRLTAKHKKLKKKYNTIRNDIYADDEDIMDSPLVKSGEDNLTDATENDISISHSDIKINESPNESSNKYDKSSTQPSYSASTYAMPSMFNKVKLNWRSQVKYL